MVVHFLYMTVFAANAETLKLELRQCAEINFTNSAGFLPQCKETTTTRTGGALGGVDAAMGQKDKEDVKFISKHCLSMKGKLYGRVRY